MTGFDYLDKQQALENCMQDEEFVLEMLRAFTNESKADDLKQAYEQGDYDTFGIYAHAVKTQARIIGATDLYESSLAMEVAAKDDDFDYIRCNYEKYMNQYRNLLDKVTSGIKTMS